MLRICNDSQHDSDHADKAYRVAYSRPSSSEMTLSSSKSVLFPTSTTTASAPNSEHAQYGRPWEEGPTKAFQSLRFICSIWECPVHKMLGASCYRLQQSNPAKLPYAGLRQKPSYLGCLQHFFGAQTPNAWLLQKCPHW